VLAAVASGVPTNSRNFADRAFFLTNYEPPHPDCAAKEAWREVRRASMEGAKEPIETELRRGRVAAREAAAAKEAELEGGGGRGGGGGKDA
jgi:hypothetical protein